MDQSKTGRFIAEMRRTRNLPRLRQDQYVPPPRHTVKGQARAPGPHAERRRSVSAAASLLCGYALENAGVPYALAARISLMSSGTTLNRSPTMP